MTCLTFIEYMCHSDHRYGPFVLSTSWSFLHSRLIIGFVTTLTRRVQLVELDLQILLKHLNSPQSLVGFVLLELLLYMYVLSTLLFLLYIFLLAIVLSVLRYSDTDCPFGIFNLFLVKSRDLNIELLTIASANIWKLSGLELKDILIQQELIFIEKDQTNIPERPIAFILKEFKFGH